METMVLLRKRSLFVLIICQACIVSSFVNHHHRPWGTILRPTPGSLTFLSSTADTESSTSATVGDNDDDNNKEKQQTNVAARSNQHQQQRNRNNNNWRQPRRNNNNNNNRSGGGGGYGVLRLVNPLQIQKKLPIPPPPRQQQQQQQGDRDNTRRPAAPRSPVTSIDNSGKTTTVGGDSRELKPKRVAARTFDDDIGPDSATTAPGKQRPARRKDRNRNNNNDNDAPRRASLRVGTGKKGRAAEIIQRRSSLKKRDRTAEKEAKAEKALERRTVVLPDTPISVSQLAEILDEKPVSVIKFLMTDLGIMASMTQNLDPSTCVAVAEGFGKVVGDDDEYDEDYDEEDDDDDSALATGFALEEEDDPEDLVPRAPVVTIMGHVDHGKTSLLDAIRDTRVTAGEAGGITQHIAAYQVRHKNDHKITFIDTPGHAAFTDMRERGANITDIVILVVAADDGVKQQTADSITCARQAGVPLVVAVNKCDLETADPTRVKTELTQYDILTEDFGGDVLCSEISAKENTNIDDLLDRVMLQAELLDLKANPKRNAEGIVVEAFLERGLGTVATTLVKKGTLKVGDVFVAGETYGRVRALFSTDDEKQRVDEVGPSVPVRVVGFEGVPAAGDLLVVTEDEQTARELAESRQRIARERQSSSYQAGLMSSVARSFGSAAKEHREMCVVVKADVQGSAEALARALRELKRENDEALVTVKVLIAEAGEVSKSDIAIASVTPGTTAIAFNVAASYAATEDARIGGIPIEYYNIVYDAIESVESRMQEILSPTPEGEYAGSATVQEVFNIGGLGNIAGSRCTDGILKKGANVRVMRGDKILVSTKIKSLRSFKSEVNEIEEGNECGIGLVDFETFEANDVIECYVD